MNGKTQRTRIWTPKEIQLAQMFYPTGELDETIVRFQVPTPDARVQVNISIIALPDPRTVNLEVPFDILGRDVDGTTPLVSAGLWLCAAELGQSGGAALPVTNLVGTHATPQLIPFDPGLMGYAETVLADCDQVLGELTLSKIAGSEGSDDPPNTMWVLKTRYQPVAGCVLCDEEWAEITSKCSPSIKGQPISFIAPA